MKNRQVLGVFLLSLLVASESSAYALINLNVGTDYNSSASSSSSGNLEIKAEADLEGNLGTPTSTNGRNLDFDSSTTIEVGQNLNVNRGMLEDDGEKVVETSAEAVLTNGDLKAYARSALRSDENLDEFRFTSKSVEVNYRQRGRLLALVPISFKARAVAKVDGDVELEYPWYSFLTLDDEERIETELQIAVDNALHARALGSVRAEGEVTNPSFTAAEAAAVAARMRATLSASLIAGQGVDK